MCGKQYIGIDLSQTRNYGDEIPSALPRPAISVNITDVTLQLSAVCCRTKLTLHR